MDLSEAFSRLASHDSTLYSGDAKVRVVSQGSLSKSTNYHRKRPYPYQNPPTENKSSYRNVIKNFDNISDPIPNSDKKEREIGDLLEEYGSTLSQEQHSVFEMILKGYNVFFTGDAGTGKSYLLRCVIEALQEQVGKEKVFITASTGIAACNIGGITVHAFAGLGISDASLYHLVRKVRQNEAAVDRWQTCEVLIIDEISMLDGQLFDTLEYLARDIRNKDFPFGGIQVVCCGDFFQLPPVGIGKNGVCYCFESRWWRNVIEKTMVMKQVFRQKDTALQQLLREVRFGRVSPQSMQLLKKMEQTQFSQIINQTRSHDKTSDNDDDDDDDDDEIDYHIESTKLFAYNRNVDEFNNQKLDSLSSPPVEFICEESFGDGYQYQFSRNCQAPAKLVLKKGAQVMLVKNLSVIDGLVNGCRGVVTSFRERNDHKKVPVVTFSTMKGEIKQVVEPQDFTIELGGVIVASRRQIPLKLAWGISIHKSQGMTIDLLEVDLHGVFEAGMTYVALSRGVSVDRMKVVGFSMSGLKTSPKVLAFHSCIVQGKEYIPYSQDNHGNKKQETNENENDRERIIIPNKSVQSMDYQRTRIQPVNQPVKQAVNQHVNQTANHSVKQTVPQQHSKVNQSYQYKQSTSQPIYQSRSTIEKPFDYTTLYTSSRKPSTSNSLLELAAGLEKLNRKYNV